ncbi:MAG: hypothetical protein LW860_11990 [Xanthomonadaceae bacterium]|jgi:hypothetical protein|nr:hypothetical protein [Xanthomonadaceae bacterium]
MPPFRSGISRSLFLGALLGFASPPAMPSTPLPTNPDAYLDQANRVRQSVDRPWAPASGRLGNLRRLNLVAKDCAVRIVSGGENRVFPGASNVVVVEESRILDRAPHEQPAPRDVTLAAAGTAACPGVGQCGVSVTEVVAAPRVGADTLCYTVQLATAHDINVSGDGVDLLVDAVRQPALRISIGGNVGQRVWFEDVELGLLSIRINAPVRIGGTGSVDRLNADSSNGASVVYLHGFRAQRTGVSATTSRTQWSVRTGSGTWAGYYQPAAAPGDLADLYPIEVDGPLALLDVPAGRVSPRLIAQATRDASVALRAALLGRSGPRAALPGDDTPGLPSAAAAARALPPSGPQRVADVVARDLPLGVRIGAVALWKQGGRIEGTAPDLATADRVRAVLEASREFGHAQVSFARRAGTVPFTVMAHFHCEAPGQPSACLAADPASPDRCTTAQLRDLVARALGPSFVFRRFEVDGRTIRFEGTAGNAAEFDAGYASFGRDNGMLRASMRTTGSDGQGGTTIRAVLNLQCAAPPRDDGICALPVASLLARDEVR